MCLTGRSGAATFREMRRALAAALLAVAIAAPAAGAKTIRVSWNEQRRLHDGTFAFHVSRIDATTSSWSAVVSIANHTKTTYGLDSGCGGWSPQFVTPGMGIIYPGGGPQGLSGGWSMRTARTAAPALPRLLAPGASWRGTIRGAGPLPRGIFLRLTFGYFVPGRPGTRSKCDPQRGFAPFDNTTWYWTTDHTFRL